MTASLRDKTAALRRAHILEAATRVFAEKGYQRATIRDVAAAAEVADGTIYNVFENKAALLIAMLDPLDERRGTPSPVDMDRDAAFIVETLLARRWETYKPEKLAMLRVLLSEALIDEGIRKHFFDQVIAPALSGLEPLLEKLTADGQLAEGDAAMTARAILASVIGLLVLRLLGDEGIEAKAEDVPAILTKLLLKGLLPSSRKGKRR